jgi:hypothetical protein
VSSSRRKKTTHAALSRSFWSHGGHEDQGVWTSGCLDLCVGVWTSSGLTGITRIMGVWTSGCLDLLGVWTSYLRVLSIHSCNRCRVHIVQHKGRSCLERRPLVARVGSTPHSPSLGVIPCPSIQLTGDGKTAAHLDASGFLSGLLIQLSDTLKNHPRSCGGLPVLGRRGSGV